MNQKGRRRSDEKRIITFDDNTVSLEANKWPKQLVTYFMLALGKDELASSMLVGQCGTPVLAIVNLKYKRVIGPS